MIQDKRVLAVIPARGGSKGLPRKNILPLGDKPLIDWTLNAADTSEYVDRFVVSSDDTEILEVARRWGPDVPLVRPAELAADNIPGTVAFHHAVREIGQGFDYAVLLQPTSPFRTAEDIDNCIRICVEKNASSAVSMIIPEKSPYWMYTQTPAGHLEKLLPAPIKANRQEQPLCLVPNGAIYVMETSRVLQETYLIVDDTVPYIMSQERSLDIDTALDMAIAELLVQRGK
ncbi:MAG: acylneuraminate cytidylyltransferase family protein [Phycisphaerae bacterium]|nr:acylneuraminate cytidylyltransferase family protein [Phycisphaerae bacterium]